MKVVKISILIFILSSDFLYSADFGNGKTLDWGFTLWNIGYSETSDITGGMYLRTGLSFTFHDRIFFNVNYDTNILSNLFKDKIVCSDVSFQLYQLGGFGTSIGPAYISSFNNKGISNYLGLSVLTINSGEKGFDKKSKLFICLFPFSL